MLEKILILLSHDQPYHFEGRPRILLEKVLKLFDPKPVFHFQGLDFGQFFGHASIIFHCQEPCTRNLIAKD